jgi:hypothetical protein
MIFRHNKLRNLFPIEYCEQLKFYILSRSFDRINDKRHQFACHAPALSHHLTIQLSRNESNATGI